MRALQGLENGNSSVRLRAALAVGTTPDPRFVDTLVERRDTVIEELTGLTLIFEGKEIVVPEHARDELEQRFGLEVPRELEREVLPVVQLGAPESPKRPG